MRKHAGKRFLFTGRCHSGPLVWVVVKSYGPGAPSGGICMRSSNEAKLAAVVAVITVGFVLIDIWWSRTSNISLDPGSWIEFAKIMALLGVLFLVMKAIERRLAADASRPGRTISYAAESIRWLIINAAMFIPLGFASIYFMYMAAATDRPLMDQPLAVIDGMIGFRWRAFLELTNNYPAVAKTLVFAYHALGPQMPVMFILLAFADRLRLTEFMAMLAVSSALTAAGMAMVPAAGAYAYFQPLASDFSNFTAHAGVWHLAELMKIRSGQPFSLLVTHAEGMVTFPSYHTALGIMITYALRRLPAIAWPVGALNAIMVVSTLPEGGHHLIDVVAGAAVGALSISAVWVAQDVYRSVDAASAQSLREVN
ncbi:phosphatase PAP2 family protein [Mesorhizobium sp.]|uniref:phosphatase PAP2 family protein n=1 Tax=Mesorhizobium sp. TaxID=1871066 RepID=UPI0025CBFBB5|nr:phosphatase PAP2 family protein [Mesorhizobium sp.]